MNDFVASVVRQVLQEGAPSRIESHIPAREPQRPNYQRERAQGRISPPAPERQAQSAPPLQQAAQGAREEPFSELRKVLLQAQSKAPTPVTGSGLPAANTAEVAVLEAADRRIAAMLGLRLEPGAAIGIAWQESGGIESLLAADQALHEFPSLDGRLRWREEGAAFLLALSGDKRDVAAAMAAFSKRAEGSFGIVWCERPSAYLQRRLRIDQAPVAAAGGISYTEALKAANDYYLSHPQSTLALYPGGGYLLAQGDQGEITAALRALGEKRKG